MVMRLHTDHNRLNAHMFRKMKLAPSLAFYCGLEDQTAEHILQRYPLLQAAKNNRVANSSPATQQTLGQQGGTGEDGHIHLADWTVSVAAIEKKQEKKSMQIPADSFKTSGQGSVLLPMANRRGQHQP